MMKRILNSRFFTKVPGFFAWIRNTGIALATACTTLLQTPEYLPDGYSEYLKYGIVAGGVAAFVAQHVSPKHDNTTTNG